MIVQPKPLFQNLEQPKGSIIACLCYYKSSLIYAFLVYLPQDSFLYLSIRSHPIFLQNTSFENWTNGKPDQWVANSTASNATISQSDVARTGTYGVKMNGTSSNTRLASTEIKFPAGYYTMTVYVYGMAETSKVRPGYVPVVLDNNAYKVGTYVYFTDAENAPKDTWTEVKHTFKLDTENIVSLVVMNPKNSGNLVVDDVEIRTATQEEQEAYEIATAISSTKVNATATGKFVENGKLVIVKGGKKYNAVGIDM